jgi:hypothetical protein
MRFLVRFGGLSFLFKKIEAPPRSGETGLRVGQKNSTQKRAGLVTKWAVWMSASLTQYAANATSTISMAR